MIYFAKRHSDGLVKIGTTKDLKRRVLSLKCQECEPVSVLAVCEGSYTAELAFHLALADSRERGEWFRDTTQLRRMMERISSYELDLNTEHEVPKQRNTDKEV